MYTSVRYGHRVITMQNGKKDVTDVKSILAHWQTCVEMANATSQRRPAMKSKA